MVSCHLVEVPLLCRQLLLVLLLENLKIEVEEPLDLRRVIGLEAVDVIKKIIEGAEYPLVQLWPITREILLDENTGYEGQLIVSIFTQDAIIWVLNKR